MEGELGIALKQLANRLSANDKVNSDIHNNMKSSDMKKYLFYFS